MTVAFNYLPGRPTICKLEYIILICSKAWCKVVQIQIGANQCKLVQINLHSVELYNIFENDCCKAGGANWCNLVQIDVN